MEESRFDRLVRMVAAATSRRTLLTTVTGLVLSRAVGGTDVATAARQRSRRRPRRQPAHQQRDRARQQRRHENHETHSAACLPTGQRCPARKVRGKKSRKLGCEACCQGSFTTDAAGKKVCGCQPNGGACTTATASSCCSGYCDGSTCQIPPSAPCSARTCAGCCDSAGACQSGTSSTACGTGGTTCSVCAGSTAVCTNHTCGSCASHAECGAGNLCVDSVCQACDVVNGQDLAMAVAAAADGDTLYICAGTYAGGFAITTNVTLIGAGQDATGTVIAGKAPGLNIFAGTEAQPVVLRGLRIQNGFPGGIHNRADRHLTIIDCTLRGLSGSVGGAIWNDNGTLLMTRCTVEDNIAERGGGLSNFGSATLIDCLFQNNEATRFGGGIYNANADPGITLRGTRVSGNRAPSDSGSGILNLIDVVGAVTLEDSVVCANNPTSGQCLGFTAPSGACLDTCPPA